MLFIHCHL
jgi:hypothetical protein